MINFIRRYKIFFILFIIALAGRLLFFGLMIGHYGPGSFYLDNDGASLDGNDSQHYVLIAKNIVEHGVYSRFVDEPFQPTAFRTPLLPFYFLPFIYFFGFGAIWLAILILDIILSLTPIVVYLLAKLFLSKKKSILIAILVAVEPLLAYRSNLAEPDALMILLFLLSLYLLLSFWLDKHKNDLLWSAAVLGVMSLAKPVGIYLLIIFILFALLKMVFVKTDWKKISLQALLAVIIFAAIVSPWLIRNKIVFGHTAMSSVQAFNFYLFYTADLTQPKINIVFDPAIREPERDLRYSGQLMEISLSRIVYQPVDYLKNHLTGTARLLLSGQFQSFYYYGHQKLLPFSVEPRHNINMTESVSAGNYGQAFAFLFSWDNVFLMFRYLFLAVIYLLVFCNWLRSFRQDKKVFAVFSLFALLSFYFVFAAGPYVDPKYRLPIIPLLWIMLFYNRKNKKLKNKIVIATGTFPPEVSGQSTFVSTFRRNLPEDIKADVVSYGNKSEKIGEDVFIIKRNIFRYFNYWRRVRRQAKDAGTIYAQDLISSGLPAALAKRRDNKLIVRIGGDFLWEKMVNSKKSGLPVSQYYYQPKSIQERFYLKIYKFVLSRCDKIIFNTQWPEKWYIDFFNIPRDKIVIIENPLVLRDRGAEASQEINNEIIYAGRFVPLKNLKRLIKAFKLVKTDKKLVLIGEGPQKAELMKLAQDDDRVVIADRMSQEDLWRRISSCYMFVLPSLSEFNPNIALEVMNLNKPVLLTQEVGFNKPLKDKFKLIDPLHVGRIKEGIEYLLNEENYSRQIEKLKNDLVAYDWNDLVKKHLKLIDHLSNEINILNIGTDKTLVGGQRLGDAIERHKKYGEFVDHLDIVVYTNKKEGLSEFKLSKNVVGHPTNSCCKGAFFFDAIRVFEKVNKNHQVSIVQCQDPFLPGLVGLWLKQTGGVKLQINFHGDFWDNPGWLKERKMNLVFLWISKLTVPRADAIRVMSEGQKEKLIKAGINEKKIRVISTPVDLRKFIEAATQRIEQQKTPVVLHIGRDDEVKDYNTLVKAFKLVKEKMPDTKFVQAGAKNKLCLAMGENNFQDISLKGHAAHQDLINLYHQSSLFVLSSISESFGKVLVEANACAKPVVSTATTGAKEIIEDGVNGFLVPIGDYQSLAEKIIYLLEHPDEAKAMGERGRQIVKAKFGDNTDKIVEFWRDIIGGNL